MTKTKDRITQVKLERPCYCRTGCITMDVCWIDSALAKKGKRVRDHEDTTIIWTVAEVYGSKDIDDLDMQYKAWREFHDKLNG